MLRRLALLAFGLGVLMGTKARCEEPGPVHPKSPRSEIDEQEQEWELRAKQRQLESLELEQRISAKQKELDEAEKQREEERTRQAYLARQHLEFGMGFLGGVRDEGRTGFVFAGGSASGVPGAQGLIDPFTTAPYNGVPVAGLGWELRSVVDHLRMTFGVQKPFTSFSLLSTESTVPVDGTPRTISPRSLGLWDLRFGFGVEHRFRWVTPYLDLLGDAQSVATDLTVDGQPASYKAWTFGFAVRAGARIHLGHYMYLAPSGEVGVYGPVRWGVSLQAGWQVPLDFD